MSHSLLTYSLWQSAQPVIVVKGKCASIGELYSAMLATDKSTACQM